jgi:hypothetical protein
MKQISKIIIGEPRIPMRLRKSIHEDLSTFIIRFYEAKPHSLSFTKVISSTLKQCHEIQKKHFNNCLNLPLERLHLIMDCFGRNLLQCGTSRN